MEQKKDQRKEIEYHLLIENHLLIKVWEYNIVGTDNRIWEKLEFDGGEKAKLLKPAQHKTFINRIHQLDIKYQNLYYYVQRTYAINLTELINDIEEANEVMPTSYDPLLLLYYIGYRGKERMKFRRMDYAKIRSGANSTYAAVFFLMSFKMIRKSGKVNSGSIDKPLNSLSEFFPKKFLNDSNKIKILAERKDGSSITNLELISLFKDVLDEYDGFLYPSKAYSHLDSLSRHYKYFRKKGIEGLWTIPDEPNIYWTIHESCGFYFMHRIENIKGRHVYTIDKFKALVECDKGKHYLKIIPAKNLLSVIKGNEYDNSIDTNLEVEIGDSEEGISLTFKKKDEIEIKDTLLRQLVNTKLHRYDIPKTNEIIKRLLKKISANDNDSAIDISFGNTLVAITRDKLYIGSYSTRRETPGHYKFLYCIDKTSNIYKKYFNFTDFEQFVGVVVCKEKGRRDEVYLGNTNLETYVKIDNVIREEDSITEVSGETIQLDRLNNLGTIEDEDYNLLPDCLQFKFNRDIKLDDDVRDKLRMMRYGEH